MSLLFISPRKRPNRHIVPHMTFILKFNQLLKKKQDGDDLYFKYLKIHHYLWWSSLTLNISFYVKKQQSYHRNIDLHRPPSATFRSTSTSHASVSLSSFARQRRDRGTPLRGEHLLHPPVMAADVLSRNFPRRQGTHAGLFFSPVEVPTSRLKKTF